MLAAISAAIVVLGGGGAAGGYYLHGSTATAGAASPAVEAFPMERGAALEQWRAAEMALKDRERQDRAEWVQAIRESNATNATLREAVVALTERMSAMDKRLTVVEAGSVRPASGKRP